MQRRMLWVLLEIWLQLVKYTSCMTQWLKVPRFKQQNIKNIFDAVIWYMLWYKFIQYAENDCVAYMCLLFVFALSHFFVKTYEAF